ncbi:hypothetical protein SLEP1_g56546 [Rubroshorea leprosula]|uniref:Uncharacterized protein n=1 Tax=Rubroshorea leprosula TaxID=152421 RepID=A0AAV5MJV9_9ROSI|nr:hypothetical protein SLEP1_g56546 [Rubroshorea leprosula]
MMDLNCQPFAYRGGNTGGIKRYRLSEEIGNWASADDFNCPIGVGSQRMRGLRKVYVAKLKAVKVKAVGFLELLSVSVHI